MMTPGTKLGGRYRLDERIATGGMGDVWRATDEVLGRVVAAKVLLPSLLNEPGFIERFRGEARVVATLTHPNIVRVYDYGESPMLGGGHVAYLVMEYVSGEPLTARLQRQGRLSAAETLPLMAQSGEALNAAHDHGIIHRDVKPGNLLIRPDGTVMLTDFGIARSAMTGGLTQAGSVLGTAAYISPEQASGQPVTGQADLYSLGIVAYQCLAGQRPFDSDNPMELAMRHVNEEPPPLPDDVPPEARAFVASALAKDTANRFASGAALAASARAIVEGNAPSTPPPSASPPSTPPPSTPPPVAATPPYGQATNPPSQHMGAPQPPPNGGPPPPNTAPPGAGQQPGDQQARGAAVPPPGRGLGVNNTAIGPVVNPYTPEPMRRHNKQLLIVAGIALLVVLVGAGITAVFLSSSNTSAQDGDKQTSQDDDDTGNEEPKSLNIDVDEYLNEVPDDVVADLKDKGFTNVDIEGNGKFTSDVSPNGKQKEGTPIVVHASPLRAPEGESPSSKPGRSVDPKPSGEKSCHDNHVGCKTR